MRLQVSPISELNGTIRIPGSKSQSVRAFLVATLAEGRSEIHALPSGEDVKAAEEVAKALGAQVDTLDCHGHCVALTSQGAPLSISPEVWTANSGITTRFVLPILGLSAQQNQSVRVDCGSQMRQRLIQSYLQNLRDLGLKIQESEGGWPLHVSGQLQGGSVTVEGLTSQYLSGLLLSACYAEQDTTMTVFNLNERPYVDMTLKWLQDHGIRFEHERTQNQDRFKVFAGQKYAPINFTVPGDFSSASTVLAAGTLFKGELLLQGLDMEDPQGDRRLIEILKDMGADIQVDKFGVKICGGKVLKGLRVDANDIPDMLPTLAVLGTRAEGGMEIVNVPQARFKETDRIHSMSQGLQKMGAKVEEREDGLTVYPGPLQGAELQGHEDHRTIMALALAGLLAEGSTTIDTAEGLNKTYPEFTEHMNALGAKLSLID
jgi:3-phosphoshikimate 1-carboxyvinyltransferase